MRWWPSADGDRKLCADLKLPSGSGLVLLAQQILDTVTLKGVKKSLRVYADSSSAALALWPFFVQGNSAVQ